MKLIEEVHEIACDSKQYSQRATEKMNDLYERMSKEILARDKRIAELEQDVKEQVNVIIKQRDKIKQRS